MPESLKPEDQTLKPLSSEGIQENKQIFSSGNGWTSYLDEETGHLYWYNVYTGETQWDY